MQLEPGKKIYFISDFHLGTPGFDASLLREKKIVRFLDKAQRDAAVVFIVGDLFDFWYEYKTVVPKGYVRMLGRIAALTDAGIPVHFFVGNHDMWMDGYFEKELNVPVYFEPKAFEFNGKQFLIGHGDGLGPGDKGYKFIKKIFRNRFCQWLFGLLHPDWGIGLANYFSRRSRAMTGHADEKFLGEENEWLISYCKEVLQTRHYDYFIFGHRHLPIDFALPQNSRYINLGDWIKYDSYGEFDGETMHLKYYRE
ncbi:MAG: UDP-2,3-diacylglucosamine diphosphatase [Flavihumibacter sp.]